MTDEEMASFIMKTIWLRYLVAVADTYLRCWHGVRICPIHGLERL